MNALNGRRMVVLSPAGRTGVVEECIADLVSGSGGRIRRVRTWPEGDVDVIVAGDTRAHARKIAIPMEYRQLARHPQGYLLAPLKRGKQHVLLIAGADDQGLSYGIREARCRLNAAGYDISRIPFTYRYPRCLKRGIYAHQHWAYNHPYSLRTWQLVDWKNYLDILALFKVNLFSIWPAACVLPMPMSREDRRYLERYESIVDYARNHCGMEVLLIETPNTILRRGKKPMPPVAARRYFDYSVLVDPKSKDFDREIIGNRSLMYRLAGDADGYSIIDSDDGGYPGSSIDDFVGIFLKNRRAINESSPRGARKWLYYWMWIGWGELQNDPDHIQLDRVEVWRDTVRGLRTRLPEPWGLFACWEKHLDRVRVEKLLSRTIYFPYGAVEGEPNGPYTELRCADIDAALALVKPYASQLRGVMCNVQTPLVQLPNIYYFHRRLWDGPPEAGSTEDILKECAALFSRRHASALSEGWDALYRLDPARLRQAGRNLSKIKQFALDGVAGPSLRRSGCDLPGDLKDSLLIHLKERELIETLRGYDPSRRNRFRSGLVGYMNANIAAARKTGFFENNFYSWKSLERIRPHLQAVNFREVMRVFNSVQNSFCRGRDKQMKEMAIEFIRSRLKVFKYW